MDSILDHVPGVDGLLQTAGDALHGRRVVYRIWCLVFLLLIDGAGEGVAQSNGRKEHLNAGDEVLPACCNCAGTDLLSVDEQRIGDDPAALKDGQNHSLPEGEKDHRLDGEEFEYRFVWPQEVTSGEEEEEESIEGQADREVVDDGNVKVSSIHIKISIMIFAESL